MWQQLMCGSEEEEKRDVMLSSVRYFLRGSYSQWNKPFLGMQ